MELQIAPRVTNSERSARTNASNVTPKLHPAFPLDAGFTRVWCRKVVEVRNVQPATPSTTERTLISSDGSRRSSDSITQKQDGHCKASTRPLVVSNATRQLVWQTVSVPESG